MNQPNARIELRIAPDDEHAEETDRFARDLLRAVRELPVESAELGPGAPPPAGTKGATLAAVGALAIGVSTNAAWDVIKFLLSRLRNRRNTVVKLEGLVGSELIRFEGTPAEFEKLAAALAAAKRAGESPAP
ncbi:MAG: hypothetical protein ACKVZ0_25450 [Gemmatimonadales bacterium]